MGLVDRCGKPFDPPPPMPSFALMSSLLKAATKQLPWNDPVRRLRATVAEVTGKPLPSEVMTIKWRQHANMGIPNGDG